MCGQSVLPAAQRVMPFLFLRDPEVGLQGLDNTMYMMQQAGTGRCPKCWQGAAATAESKTLQSGAIPNSGAPDSVQDQCNVSGQGSSQRPAAEHLKELHVHWKQGRVCSFSAVLSHKAAAWQSKRLLVGPWTSSEPFQEAPGILWNSASLRGPGGAALHCGQDCALVQRVVGVGSMEYYSVQPGVSLAFYHFSVLTLLG